MTNKKKELPEVKVESNKTLPQTGEKQSVLFAVLGVSTLIGAGVLYWVKKKRSAE